ncbi:MAG: hypothetical protein HZA54_20715 [Planctomycetes bacterium]|nr:hypothetical protein [Planctomycetota bacterium]
MPHALRRLALVALLSLLLPAANAAADTGVFDEAWRTIQRRFYDKKLNGLDWKAVREKYRGEAADAEDPAQLHGVIKEMLGELKASHTALIEHEVYRTHYQPEMSGKTTWQAGIEIARRDGGWYVAVAAEGGPAERAGARKGDRVLAINDVAPAESADLEDSGNDCGVPSAPRFYVRVEKGQEASLLLQSTADEASLHVVRFKPERLNMIEASRRSIRVIERDGRQFGYVHLHHFLAQEIGTIFSRAIAGPLADCDGLVLDLRGRGGSPFVMNRVYQDVLRRWKKPVVVLIDEGTRSAKEIFAHNFQRARRGLLVGRRTPGAVLGSEFIPLSDGSVMLLPVVDVPMLSGGVRLEGIGVTPDVEVRRPDLLTGGRDLILERGLEALGGRLKEGGERARRRSAEGL